MGKVDYHYTISDQRLVAYSKIPIMERLKWLDEIVRFTLMVRAAPTGTESTAGSKSPSEKLVVSNKEN